ncbi:MAG: aminoacyl-tRNA hydrolase [Candidatus Latescibacterota bacterium]|nr:aminoacyl-tRNA hydrolase [Candidatus Latescibacterota bacterium]
MRVIVGLGNPGSRYELTRHNIGFLVVDQLADEGAGRWTGVDTAVTARLACDDEEVCLVKPLTFMNRSGRAVARLRQNLTFENKEMLVVLDDFLLDFGRVRLRRGGSDGGHNGLASVLESLHSEQIARLRLGVGPVPENETDTDFVLQPFAVGEDVTGLIERGCIAARCWLAEGVEPAMNRFNGYPSLSREASDEA